MDPNDQPINDSDQALQDDNVTHLATDNQSDDNIISSTDSTDYQQPLTSDELGENKQQSYDDGDFDVQKAAAEVASSVAEPTTTNSDSNDIPDLTTESVANSDKTIEEFKPQSIPTVSEPSFTSPETLNSTVETSPNPNVETEDSNLGSQIENQEQKEELDINQAQPQDNGSDFKQPLTAMSETFHNQTQPGQADGNQPINTPYQTNIQQSSGEKENIYTEICSQIIQEQEKIIGSLAIEQANQVNGLAVNPATYHCVVTGDGSKVINDLIEQYRDFFGHAAVEVCKEAASKFLTKLPADQTPELLR